ncbi:hypothetical protein EZV73_24580 [Acidaminobacter sp. JC074]|uniref:S41 family peptidase n=1 Tax=Acidaminobacter sp. JC074 TaxID=2530199 RepID=UPI001F0ED3AB|nr:S41 family peptidase [Acidaminobacter sp. JC074]MCH4890778.1 hypothetical protein [Acidaminobacter sp. JC074]
MKRVLVLMLAVLVFVSCSEEQSPEVKKAIEDLDVLIEKAEAIHPDLYKYTSKETFDSKVNQVKSSFETGDQVEFYRLVAPIFASLGDGVTELEPMTEYFIRQIKKGDNFFPYEVEFEDGRLFVYKSYVESNKVPEGAEIISIDGIKTEVVYQEMTDYVSGLTSTEKDRKLTERFQQLYFILYGSKELMDLEYVANDHVKTLSVQTAGIDDTLQAPIQNMPSYTYEVIDSGLAKISIHQFHGFIGFKQFMEATQKKILDDDIDTLVIDLRDSIGGNNKYNEYLMSLVTDIPFRLYGDITAKVSKEVLSANKNMKANYSDNVGELVRPIINDELRPFKQVKPFEGDVYVVVNSETLNEASEFAALIKDYGVATLIGQETGSNPSSFKSEFITTTPNLQMKLMIPYQYYLRPSGENTKKGVVPDVISDQPLQYILDNRN